MLGKILYVCPVLCLAFAQPANDAQAKKDLAQMQGAWVLHALEINGKDEPANRIANTLLIVKGNEYATKVKGKLLPGFRMNLDPGKNPKHMDMTQNMPGGTEQTIKAIYKLDGDTFTLCRGLSAEQERPNQFATWPNTNYFVVTWKRQAK